MAGAFASSARVLAAIPVRGNTAVSDRNVRALGLEPARLALARPDFGASGGADGGFVALGVGAGVGAGADGNGAAAAGTLLWVGVGVPRAWQGAVDQKVQDPELRRTLGMLLLDRGAVGAATDVALVRAVRPAGAAHAAATGHGLRPKALVAREAAPGELHGFLPSAVNRERQGGGGIDDDFYVKAEHKIEMQKKAGGDGQDDDEHWHGGAHNLLAGVASDLLVGALVLVLALGAVSCYAKGRRRRDGRGGSSLRDSSSGSGRRRGGDRYRKAHVSPRDSSRQLSRTEWDRRNAERHRYSQLHVIPTVDEEERARGAGPSGSWASKSKSKAREPLSPVRATSPTRRRSSRVSPETPDHLDRKVNLQ
eukprot:g4708.t1